MEGPMDILPAETLSPLAARVDEVLALYGYELTPTIDAIDAAVPGFGGLFAPQTTDDERWTALDAVLAAGPPTISSECDTDDSHLVLYVDGSSRGNPGPAGAGAVIQRNDTDIARLGRPVGSPVDNNIAEYAALQLGLQALVTHYNPTAIEVRIDSMTVIEHIWTNATRTEPVTPYSPAINGLLSTIPEHEWTHLSDSEPNPADARATVGADIAALGPA
ncbi:ribonuclease HI family protein [Halovenus rubra]|uniref:Ribonuclease HI family protein n=2 Tax=Halovenus rubra TaxID=869890 RepID=A0ABD5X0Y0_9EURY|nr:ribonuclease HI family protein [Halovenus rubra]